MKFIGGDAWDLLTLRQKVILAVAVWIFAIAVIVTEGAISGGTF